MTSETDSSSTDATSFGLQTAYALYRYNDKSELTRSESAAPGSRYNDFSLSLVISSLDTTKETELRLYLCKRLPKCYSAARSSHIGSVDICISEEQEEAGILCYYNLFERKMASDPLALDMKDFSSHYVVCLMSSTNALLDLFRPELDSFSEELVSRLDAGDPLLFLESDLPTPESVEEQASSRLENWYHHCTLYLSQCVKHLGTDVKYLLYSALVDIPVQISSSDTAFEGVVQRFVQSCSVSELLQQPVSGESTNKQDSDSDASAVLVSIPSSDTSKMEKSTPDVLQIHQENLHWKFSSNECSRFCEEWAEALVEGQANKNVVYLRQVIDNYKLKAIHDLNRLKRLLKEAQDNYYSLFRCMVFLRDCGNAVVLLRQAYHEDSLTQLDDSISVLRVLKECLGQSPTPCS